MAAPGPTSFARFDFSCTFQYNANWIIITELKQRAAKNESLYIKSYDSFITVTVRAAVPAKDINAVTKAS